TLTALSWSNFRGQPAQQIITTTLGILLLVTATFLLMANAVRQRYASAMGGLSIRTISLLTVLLGFVMGALVSFTSVGAGVIGVTALLFLHPKLPIARVIGSDIAHAVPLTFVAGAGHWLFGSIDGRLLQTLLVGSLPGVVAGSYLVGRLH